MKGVSRFIKDFIDSFTRITTGITLVCAISLSLSDVRDFSLYSSVLWQVLAAGAATGLITAVCLPCTLGDRDVSKKGIYYTLFGALYTDQYMHNAYGI